MLVSFLNSFMSYLLLMVVIIAVAGAATAIGITMVKKKNAGQTAGESGTDAGAGNYTADRQDLQ